MKSFEFQGVEYPVNIKIVYKEGNVVVLDEPRLSVNKVLSAFDQFVNDELENKFKG